MTRWSLPDELPYAFAHERSHFPGPVRALDFALNVKAMEEGFNTALVEYGLPLRVIDLHLSHFVYEALVDAERPPVAKPGALRSAKSILDVAIDELPRLWPDEWLPAVRGHLEFWRDFELEGATNVELAKHFRQTRDRSLDMWAVHFRVFLPMLVAISRFQALCAEILDDWTPDDVAAMLAGIPSKTTEGDDVLWQLGRELYSHPELAKALGADGWPAVRQALAASSDGRAFLGRLETYLRDFGRRGRDWSIDRPFLVEDPSSILAVLRIYATASGQGRATSRAEQEAKRVEMEAACARRLAEAPHPLRRAFQRLRQSARSATWLSEESYHWIEGLGSYSVRRVCLETGRRLVDIGVLNSRDDVFHLEPAEVIRGLSGADLEAIKRSAEARKADFTYSLTLKPPPVLGSLEEPSSAGAGAAPSSRALPEVLEALDLFFGAPIEHTAGTAEVSGYGASLGIARGPVRVVASVDDADKVRTGDILVAHTTSPGWTPLFRSIAALVTDTGGVLCHAAVVAREYGLPAVVGASDATQVLADGQWVEVDGGAGTVRRVEDTALSGIPMVSASGSDRAKEAAPRHSQASTREAPR